MEGPLKIAGKEIPLRGHPRFDNPYLRTAHGQDRFGISAPGHRLVIHFKTGERREEIRK